MMVQDNMVSILGWIKYEKAKWLQNNNPEVSKIVYKLAQDDEKTRKLDNVRKLWNAILEIRPVKNIFMDGDINREIADVLEVLQAICVARGYSLDEFETMRSKKADECGRFIDKIF